jgi:hypothetical protein
MSFDPSLPSVRDRLRLQLGDTTGVAATEFLGDGTYDAVYAYNGNNEIAALVSLAQALIAKFAQAASRINLGDMSFSWRDRMVAWNGIITKFKGVAEAQAGGGFNIQSPSRLPNDISEYRRIYYMGEPWFND